MSRYARLLGFTAVILAALIVGPAHAVTIATVPVGYAGNAPDPTTGSLYGAVPYNYNIGKYDVTNAQYVEFLNAKASASDPYGLWNSVMVDFGGISRSGAGPFVYSVNPTNANKPAIGVTAYDAIRFVNWLDSGQGNGDTENGSYRITNGGNNAGMVVVPDATQRAAWAGDATPHWLLPSDNEWYKSAYFDGPANTYYAYPFQSDSIPTALLPPGNSNSGNFDDVAPFAGENSGVTDVGAYPQSLSPFGALDMGGNVAQWNESAFRAYSGPELRGGFWNGDASELAASWQYPYVSDPTAEGYNLGFRVVTIGGVPEPSTALLAALAFGVIWFTRRRVQSNDADI